MRLPELPHANAEHRREREEHPWNREIRQGVRRVARAPEDEDGEQCELPDDRGKGRDDRGEARHPESIPGAGGADTPVRRASQRLRVEPPFNGKTGGVPAVPQPQPEIDTKRPQLVFFYSPLSGRCRRVEGFIAQVLQRRRNHDTFELVRVSVDSRPDLAEKFRIEGVPTICVVEGRRLQLRITAPRGCRELERELEPWLH